MSSSKTLNVKGTSNNYQFVTPVQAGVQWCQGVLDSCFRRDFNGTIYFTLR